MSAWNPTYTLTSHQTEAVISVIKAWTGVTTGKPLRKVMIVCCTAFGKTIVSSRIIWRAEAQGKRSLFLVDRDELVNQAVEKLYKTCGIVADVEKGTRHASLDAGVVVASVQSLSKKKRLERFPSNHFQIIIDDECHLSLSASQQKVLKYFDTSCQLGVTATPARGDRKNLMSYWEFIAYQMTLFDGINEGLIVPVKVCPIIVNADLSKVKADVDEQIELAKAMEPLNDEIIDQWENHANGRRTLWFHPSIAFSRVFSDRLRARGHSAKHIDGDSKDRAEILTQFENSKLAGHFKHLNNMNLLVTGVDLPGVSCIVPVRVFKTKTPYQQAIGRGTRLNCPHGCRSYCNHDEAKKNLLLFDLYGSYPELGVMTAADLCSDAPEHTQTVMRAILERKESVSLQDISELIAGEREQAFLKEISKAKRFERMLVYDARSVAAMYKAHELFDYDPKSYGKWASEPVMVEQRKYMALKGVDPRSVKNRGHAAAVITLINKTSRQGAPTIRQIARLHQLGQKSDNLTRNEASKLIEELCRHRTR